MYSENDFRSYELYHHGILGQKWGKRNGPPYPLDSSDHSASEKKAGWRDSLDDGNDNSKAKAKEDNGSNSKATAKATNNRSGSPTAKKVKKESESQNTAPEKSKTNKKGFGAAVKDAIRKSVQEYAHDTSLEAEYARKIAERDMNINRTMKNIQNVKKAKGLVGKADALLGAGSSANDYKERAKYYDKMADTFMNKNERKAYRIKAENARIRADYEADRSKNYTSGKALSQAGHDFLFKNNDIMNMKYITDTGKVSTRGKEALRSAAWQTVFSIGFDVATGGKFKTDKSKSYLTQFSDTYKRKERLVL